MFLLRATHNVTQILGVLLARTDTRLHVPFCLLRIALVLTLHYILVYIKDVYLLESLCLLTRRTAVHVWLKVVVLVRLLSAPIASAICLFKAIYFAFKWINVCKLIVIHSLVLFRFICRLDFAILVSFIALIVPYFQIVIGVLYILILDTLYH